MPLDTAIASYLAKYYAQEPRPYSSYTPVELRREFNAAFESKTKPTPIEVGSVVERQLQLEGRQIQCRVYTPNGAGLHPALMYFHGGGFVIRDNMDIYDQTCRRMCADANCVVIAVDFRLAPEHPFPAAPEDCYAATCWAYEHADELGIDPNHFGVWGESCGGNLAAVVSLMARDRNGPQLACQIIITAMLNPDFSTPSYQENGQGGYFLTEDSMRWFWQHYLGNEADQYHPYCVPIRAEDLSDLPPALVVTVEFDPLRDEGKAYANALKSAGIHVDYQNYSGLIHGFFDLTSLSEAANQACEEIIAHTQQMLIPSRK